MKHEINMETESTNTDAQKKAFSMNPRTNRLLYAAFTLLAIWGIISGDYALAASQLGIALVFDPFDPTLPFMKRPKWQIAWLIVHLLAVLGAIALELIYL